MPIPSRLDVCAIRGQRNRMFCEVHDVQFRQRLLYQCMVPPVCSPTCFLPSYILRGPGGFIITFLRPRSRHLSTYVVIMASIQLLNRLIFILHFHGPRGPDFLQSAGVHFIQPGLLRYSARSSSYMFSFGDRASPSHTLLGS